MGGDESLQIIHKLSPNTEGSLEAADASKE